MKNHLSILIGYCVVIILASFNFIIHFVYADPQQVIIEDVSKSIESESSATTITLVVNNPPPQFQTEIQPTHQMNPVTTSALFSLSSLMGIGGIGLMATEGISVERKTRRKNIPAYS